jgi:hypothetical protein
VTATTGQAANSVLATPDSATGAVSVRALVANDLPNHSTAKLTSGTLPLARGGTNVTGTPTNGQLLVGNGSGYTLATITAGTNITVTNGIGTIQIDASSSGLPLSGGTMNDGANIAFGTTTGTQLGTGSTQKIGFYGATPVVKPTSTTDLRAALINLGLYTTGGRQPAGPQRRAADVRRHDGGQPRDARDLDHGGADDLHGRHAAGRVLGGDPDRPSRRTPRRRR